MGIRKNRTLVAMAGERMRIPGFIYVEIRPSSDNGDNDNNDYDVDVAIYPILSYIPSPPPVTNRFCHVIKTDEPSRYVSQDGNFELLMNNLPGTANVASLTVNELHFQATCQPAAP